MHINRDLHALRFALIFFFCSENLRLFFNQSRFIKIHYECSSWLALLSLFTVGKLVPHMCTLVQHTTCNHSPCVIQIYMYISVFKIKVATSIYLSFFCLNITPLNRIFDNLLRANINICSTQFVQNEIFEDVVYIRCIKIMKIDQ